jgi:hypothetical protein
VKQTFPLEVPANGEVVIVVAIEPTAAGLFCFDEPLFLDDGGVREVRLSVVGNAAAAVARR